jgi:heat shock protein HtpX
MPAAFGLYTHIHSNQRRSIALLIGLFFLIYLMTFAGALLGEALFRDVPVSELRAYEANPLGYTVRSAWQDLLLALPWVTAGAAAWIVIAYYYHQSLIDGITGANEVTRKQEPRLYSVLENLCISRGIPMPKLKVMESDALNAFATGLNESQYSITVTTGLLKWLNDAELESVLGHELTHIRNGDVRMMMCAVVIVGVISFFGELVFRSMRGMRGRGKGAGLVILIALAIVALCWVLSIVIQLALSRKRELLADAGSVELTKNPDAMISALRKIEGNGELPDANSAIMELCVDNPREGFDNLFDTHPSVDSRVAALVQFAGGHDPGAIALPIQTKPPEDGEDEVQAQLQASQEWESRTAQEISEDLECARTVAATQYVADGEALIKQLGGTVVYQNFGVFSTREEKIIVRIFGQEHSFETPYDMAQWIIKEVVPKVMSRQSKLLS